MKRLTVRARLPAVAERLRARRTRMYVFLAFFAAIALFGGGARGDIVSLVVLRPLAIIIAAYGLMVARPGELAAFRPLWLLLLGAFASVAWQLIPLPPGVWHGLPLRETIVDIDRILELEPLWRPAALSPTGAWNALFALAVPAAMAIMYAAIDPPDRAILLSAIATFACASALVGLLQLLGDPDGALFFYNVTNAGLPVGLFANSNHQAVFLAAAMPVLALLAARQSSRERWVMPAAIAGEVLLLMVIVFAGSRAGLVCAAVGGLAAAAIFANPRYASARPARASGLSRGLMLGGVATLVFAAVPLLLLAADRGAVLTQFMAFNSENELRILALPYVADLLGRVWLLGVGAGSFAKAYQIVEPDHLLGPNYLNQAHADWLQVPIELGLPGVLALAGGLVLLARGASRVVKFPGRANRSRIAAVLAVPVVFAIASIVDYPLRTPSIASVALLWLAAMAFDPALFFARAERGHGSQPHSRFTAGQPAAIAPPK